MPSSSILMIRKDWLSWRTQIASQEQILPKA